MKIKGVNCSTIITKGKPHLSYTGIILHKGDGYWVFSTRYEGKNVIWECHPDYWDLYEEVKIFSIMV